LADRSSRAHRIPGKTAPEVEERIVELRQTRQPGPARIGPLVGLAASTVHAVLPRRGLHAWPGWTGPPGSRCAATSVGGPAS
jgi:hypothetical protein